MGGKVQRGERHDGVGGREMKAAVRVLGAALLLIALPACQGAYLMEIIQAQTPPPGATSWESLGYVSAGSAGEYWETYSRTAIAFSAVEMKPIVAFREGGAIKVKKWSSGTNWTDLGTLGEGSYPSLTIDPSDGKPFVAFSGSARVMKWSSGTTWDDYGSAGTGIQTLFTCIAADPVDNKPIVAFVEGQGDGRVRVKKWSAGTAWTDFGFASMRGASFLSVAVGEADGKPVVAYSDVNGGYVTRVMKWSKGTSWDDLRFPDWLEGTDTALVIDHSDNKPVVMNRGGHVLKWSSGSSWTDMGTPIPNGRLMLPSIVLDPADQASGCRLHR